MKANIKWVVIAWLTAGAIDILSAILILGKGNALGVLKYVASGLIGKSAFEPGVQTAFLGLGVHFFVAAFWTLIYYSFYFKVGFDRLPFWISAPMTGLFIFLMMGFVINPSISQVAPRKPFTVSQLPNMALNAFILAYAFGGTLKYFASKVYSS